MECPQNAARTKRAVNRRRGLFNACGPAKHAEPRVFVLSDGLDTESTIRRGEEESYCRQNNRDSNSPPIDFLSSALITRPKHFVLYLNERVVEFWLTDRD